MATNVNRGSQKLLFDFRHPIKGSEYNYLLRHLIKPGVYRGLELTIAAANTVIVSPGDAFFHSVFGSLDVLGSHILFQTQFSEIIPQTNPLENEVVWLEFEYVDAEEDWAAIKHDSVSNYLSNSNKDRFVVLGEIVYTAGLATSISKTRRTWGLIDFSAAQSFKDSQLFSNILDSAKRFYFSGSDITSGQTRIVSIPDENIEIGGAPQWAASTKYKKDAIRVFSGTLYQALSDHTSSASFPNDLLVPYWQAVGGSGGGGSADFTVVVANSFIPGQRVRHVTGTTWALAQSDSNTNTGDLRGVITEANSGQFVVRIIGELELTNAEWDAVLDAGEPTGGLIAGTEYYLSSTEAGKLTSTQPAISDWVLRCLSNNAGVSLAFIYNLPAVESGVGNTVIHKQFTGDGTTTDFVLDAAPPSDQFCFVFVGGAYQDPSKYSLSGSTITISPAPLDGTEINVMSIIAVTFNTDISQYVQRTTLTLADDAQVILNSAGTVFPTVANGMYEVWDQSDANTYGLISFTDGTPPTFDLRDASTNTVGTDTDTNLCFFVSGNNMIIRNRLGSSKTFVIHRKI